MPIVFAPPSPAGNFPGLEMQAGAGQAAMQGLPTMQRAISDLIQSYAQRGAVQQRAQSDNAALQLRAQEYALGRQDDAARDNAHMQQQADMQAAAQQHQINLLEMEPTQRDMMRRAQLHGALADAQDALAQKIITPEQFETIKANAYGYLTPINQKLAQARLAQQQATTQAQEEEAARIRRMTNMQMGDQLGFWHKTANQLAGVTDPQPGDIFAIPIRNKITGELIGHQVTSPEGKTTWVPHVPAQGAEKLPPGVMNEQQFTGRVEAAMKMTDSDIEKGRATDWGETFDRNKARMGIPASGSYAEYLQSRLPQGKQGPAAPRSSDAPASPTPDAVGQQAFDAARQQGVQLPEWKPLNPSDPKAPEKMTDGQKMTIDAIKPLSDRLGDRRLSAGEQEMGRVLLGTARQAVVMGDRQEYERSLLSLNQLLNLAKNRPQPFSFSREPQVHPRLLPRQ